VRGQTNVPFTPLRLDTKSWTWKPQQQGAAPPKPSRSQHSAAHRRGLPNLGVKLLRQAGIDHSGYGGNSDRKPHQSENVKGAKVIDGPETKCTLPPMLINAPVRLSCAHSNWPPCVAR
jgi:hypothetical protein